METRTSALDVGVVLMIFRSLTRGVAAYAVVQGLFIILGGRERWSSPSLAIALSVPGAPASWGIALLIAGILVYFGLRKAHNRLIALALVGIGVWNLFFAVTIAWTALHNQYVTTTGAFTYTFFAILACIMGVAYLHPRR